MVWMTSISVLINLPAQKSMGRRATPRAGTAPPTSPRDDQLDVSAPRRPYATFGVRRRRSWTVLRYQTECLAYPDCAQPMGGSGSRQPADRNRRRQINGRAGHRFDKEPHIFISNSAQPGPTLASIAGHLFGAARVRAADGLIMGHDARCKQPARRRARDVQPPCWHHRDNLLLRQALCAR